MCLLSVFLFSVLCVSLTNAQQTIQADLLYQESGMGNGYLSGRLFYSWSRSLYPSYVLNFTDTQYKVLYTFNANRGAAQDYKNQYKYRSGPGCPGGCETGTIAEAMPQLFIDSRYQQSGSSLIGTRNCLRFIPSSTYTDSPIKELFVTAATWPYDVCRANFVDGRVFIFRTTLSATFNQTLWFTTPTGCSCTKPIDIVMVLDRSGSINREEFASLKTFMGNFITYFQWSTSQALLGIVQFDKTALLKLQVQHGNSYEQVKKTVDALDCCGSGTCITCGQVAGAKALKDGRDFATKVLIVLTDGAANRQYLPSVFTRVRDDLINGRELSMAMNEGLLLFAVGVGGYAQEETRIITNNAHRLRVPRLPGCGVTTETCIVSPFTSVYNQTDFPNPGRILSTTDFFTLGNILQELSAKVCDTNAQPCGACCGYCSCGACTKPATCPDGPNFCDVGEYKGVCCTTKDRECPPPNKCFVGTCNRALNNGNGGCIYSPISLPAENACYRFICNNATGIQPIYKLSPPANLCVDTYCDDTVNPPRAFINVPRSCPVLNRCNSYYCNLADGKCKEQVNVTCPTPNKCSSGSCNSSTGRCQYTNVSCTSTPCTSSRCNGTTGICDLTSLVPPAPNDCYSSFCDRSGTTERVVINRPKNCTGNNKCVNYVCVNRTGLCDTVPKVNCTSPNKCFSSTCNPDTGTCVVARSVFCEANSQCFSWECVNATGICNRTFLGVKAHPCQEVTCNETSKTLMRRNKTCTGPDACQNYFCSTATGDCTQAPKTFPTNPVNAKCQTFSCNSSSATPSNPFFLVNKECTTTNLCAPFVCVNSTGECTQRPVVCNNVSDLCDLTTCNPATGRCNPKTYKPCPTKNCDSTCTCLPSTGACFCNPKVCSPDGCRTRSCNISNGNCTLDFEICSDSCKSPNCTALNNANKCFSFSCDTTVTQTSQYNNCFKVTPLALRLCTAHIADRCLNYTGCVNSSGCQYTNIECPPSPDKCTVYIKNSSRPGCCQPVNITCDLGDVCTIYGCNKTTGCTSSPKCPRSSPCFNRGCYTNGTCWSTPNKCQPSNPCMNVTSCNDAVGGGCVEVPLICAEPQDKCKRSVRNISNPQCCQEEPTNKCLGNDKCFDYFCNSTTSDCTFAARCLPSDACTTRGCYSENGTCWSIPRNCSSSDPCVLFDGCNVTMGGCVPKPVTCNSLTPPNPCTEFIRDSTFPTCCRPVPKDCNKGDLCQNYTCNPITGCQQVPICPPSTNCTISTCQAGVCSSSAVVCSSPDPCIITSCSEEQGGCFSTSKNCSDGDLCTVDSCNATGQCVNKPIVCPSSDRCTVSTCVGGSCSFSPLNCDDKNNCTVDKCDPSIAAPASPCVNTPINASVECNDNNLCTLDTCDPAAGCINIDISSSCNTTEDCTVSQCLPGRGCVNVPLSCALNSTAQGQAYEVLPGSDRSVGSSQSGCDIAVCEPTEKGKPKKKVGERCSVRQQVCIDSNVVAVAAGLGAGVLAGIIIGVIIFVGLAGGGGYAAYQGVVNLEDGMVKSNPLYVQAGTGGVNPLFQSDDNVYHKL